MVHGREQVAGVVARQPFVDEELLLVVCFSTSPPSFLPSLYATSTVSSASETHQKTHPLTFLTFLTSMSRPAPEKEGIHMYIKTGCE